MNKIAVEGLSIIVTTPGFVGTVNYTIQPTNISKVKINNKAIITNSIEVTVNGVFAGCNGIGSGSILAKEHKFKINNNNVLTETDNVNILCTGTLVNPPNTACSFTVNVMINNANQNKVFI